jgi:spore germination cell wall hydrolase CwlJ-like protein
MSKIFTRILAAFLCVFALNTQALASSVLISSMTLLGSKPATDTHQRRVEAFRFHQKELNCMALGLYHEARGEPIIGQYAVGATILNRVRSSAYPDSVCGVVFQNNHLFNRCQFSFACDGITDVPGNKSSFKKMQRLAAQLLNKGIAREAKFIGGAFHASAHGMTHYHRHDVYPGWSTRLEKLTQLGAHVFFKSTRVTKRYIY